MTQSIFNIHAGWKFDHSYARLPSIFYTKLAPTPVRSPKLVILNKSLASSLGLDEQLLLSDTCAATFAGNRLPEGALPLAQAYAGHQFGHFARLGDGRAILIGEHIAPNGERVDIQLKGSGRTPYSRGGDGRAALGPMLREYIISEAMHGLGIPTTRSLAVVTTGEEIIRETMLPGAILTRVAASHIRVGTFQYAAVWGTTEDLKSLADYTLERHFPDVAKQSENRYLALLQHVIQRQAELIAKWQLVGFIHGVMNTDNMALSGETIDYGPCAFMDTYDPKTVFSSIDTHGRYAYGNQPTIGAWNLARFAESLLPLLHDNEDEAIKLAEEAIESFVGLFQTYWFDGMRSKLGILNQEAEDEALIEDLLALMQQHRADFTNTFVALTLGQYQDIEMFETSEKFRQWVKRWQTRLDRQSASKETSLERMRQSNPAVIPRNHRVEEALEAATEREDFSVMEKLLAALAEPYAHRPDQREYCTLPPHSEEPYRTFCGT